MSGVRDPAASRAPNAYSSSRDLGEGGGAPVGGLRGGGEFAAGVGELSG